MIRPGLYRNCVHCGLCLPKCPTYSVLREEADSPRGRIYLLEALAEGRATPAEVRPHIDRCIGCLACETACPSGVPYRAILDKARVRLGGPPWHVRLFLRHILPRPRLLRIVLSAMGRAPRRSPPPPLPAPPSHPRARVALHLGCVTPILFPDLAPDAAFVLTRLGYRVEVPAGQACCGALHRHSGLSCSELEERNRRAFEGFDHALTPAAGCSTTPGLTDLTAFLLREEALAGAALPPVSVAYHPPCHLLHAQTIDAGPLLERISGVRRVPLPDAGQCCGAGGLYMELQREMAQRVREAKIDAIAASGAGVVATGNPGCMLWIAGGLRRRGLPIEVVHPVTLLARALRPR